MISYLDARSSILALSIEQLQMSATAKEETLNRWLETHRKATVSLTLLPEVKTPASILLTADGYSEKFSTAYRQMESLMSVAFASQSDVRDISILTANEGKIIFSTNPNLQGQSRTADEYFIEGLKQTYVQSVYLFPNTNQPTLTISTPILGENNQTLGVLAVHLNLETAATIIAQSESSLNENVYWVNRFQVPIYTNTKNPQDLPRRLQTQGVKAAIKQENGTHQELNYVGEPILGVHRWLDQWNTVLLIEKKRSQVLQPIHKLATNILFTGLSFIIILPLIIYKLARHLAQPLLTVATGTQEISRGNLRLIPMTTPDEVGTLTTAINRITRQLYQLYSDLEENNKVQVNSEDKSLEISQETEIESSENRTLSTSESVPETQNLTIFRWLNDQNINQFLEAIPLGIVVLDTQGNICYSNLIAQNLFGPGSVPNAEPNAEIYPSYIAGTEQMYAEEDLPLVRALRGETTTVDNIEVYQGNQQNIPIQAWGNPIYDESGNLTFAIATFQILSEHKTA
ncbi:MAG: cache domain-containing protein [Cyanobacteria bacterium J06592_8]